MKFTKHVLKNGLRIVLAPMQDIQTATAMILVEAGSKYENKSNNGISHFLEHMMFKGTKNRPSTKIISEELDQVGGDYNAFTSKEQTGYWVKVPTQHFEMALDVVSDLYLNPLLEEKEIEKERGVILQEMAMYRDTPARYVWDIFEELLYGDQPAGWDIIGTEQNIRKFRRSDFLAYMKKHYIPPKAVVAIAGNFNQERVLKHLKKTFGPAKRNRRLGKAKTKEKQNVPAYKIFYKETDQTHLILGVRAINMFDPRRYAAAVLSAVLGGGFSSRVFLNIREKHGLAYYIDAGTEQMTDAGFLFVRAGVEHRNLEKTVKLMLKELRKLKEKEVSAKELKKAKEYLKGKLIMSLESTNAVANFCGNQELFRKRLEKIQTLFQKIDAVSAKDVQQLSKKILLNKGLNLAVIGPHKKFPARQLRF